MGERFWWLGKKAGKDFPSQSATLNLWRISIDETLSNSKRAKPNEIKKITYTKK